MTVIIETPLEDFPFEIREKINSLNKKDPELKLKLQGLQVDIFQIPFWSWDLWQLMWLAFLIKICLSIVPNMKDKTPKVTFKL